MNLQARLRPAAVPASVLEVVPAEALFPSWRGRESYRPRLEGVTETLMSAHPGLSEAVAALSFPAFEAAHAPDLPVHKYNGRRIEAEKLIATLPALLRAPWLSALLLWNIGHFEERFATTGLNPEFALHYADAFHRILDQIAEDPTFPDLSNDCFIKDLWLTRAVMIPAFAQVWWPRSGLPLKPLLRAGPASASYVFLRCGGRKPMMEGHTHDPVAKAYWNEKGWGEALRLAALALPALPQLRGVFGTAWFYDPVVKEVSPRLSFAQDLQAGRGAHCFKVGSNEAAISNATATSASRRSLYDEGKYLPTDYTLVWSRGDLSAAYGA